MLQYNKEIILSKYLKCGYYKFIDGDHPLHYVSDNSVYLHRHIASLKVGHWLTSEEHVHHIDENKLNNDPDNIEVLSNKEHMLKHYPEAKFNYDDKRSKILVHCLYCGEMFHYLNRSKGYYCSIKCHHSDSVKDKTITKELLDELIPFYAWSVLGPMLGYSDTGIKKRAKALGCDITKAKYRHKGQVEERNTL